MSLDPHMVVAKLNVNDAGKEEREMERLSRRYRGILNTFRKEQTTVSVFLANWDASSDSTSMC